MSHLHGTEVSFVTGSDHSLGDLLTAVLVCSHTYEEFERGISGDGIQGAIIKWQRRLSGGLLGRLRRKVKLMLGRELSMEEILGFNFEEECSKLENYFDQFGAGRYAVNNWARPTTRVDRKAAEAAKSTKVPEYEVLLELMVSELGFSESEARELPLPAARWKWAIHAERKGLLEIVDIEEATEEFNLASEFERKVEKGEIHITPNGDIIARK